MSLILAILSKVSIKDWIYCGLIVALLVGFGAYTIHERHIGAQKVIATDEKVRQKQVKANATGEKNAQSTIDKAVQEFNSRVADVDMLNSVRNATNNSGSVSSRTSSTSSSDASPAACRVLPQETLDDNQRAEAEIISAQLELAQKTIRAYQAQGVVAK